MENTGMIATERTFFGTQPQYKDGSQKQRLLSLLFSRPFVPLNVIMDLRIADHNRVKDYLKDDGYEIDVIHRKTHATYILRGFDERKKKKRMSLYAQIWHSITSHF